MSDLRLTCGCRFRDDGSFSNVCIDHQKEQNLEEEIKEWREAREVLYEETVRLNQWVTDLQSGMYVNCVYCGHRYGPGETTPVSMADVLKEHVEQCPKHPMSKLRIKVEELEDERLAWQHATGLCVPSEEDGGSPGGVKPKHLILDLRKRETEVERLKKALTSEAECASRWRAEAELRREQLRIAKMGRRDE